MTVKLWKRRHDSAQNGRQIGDIATAQVDDMEPEQPERRGIAVGGTAIARRRSSGGHGWSLRSTRARCEGKRPNVLSMGEE